MDVETFIDKKNIETLYHSSTLYFDEFNRCGDRIASMGVGYYFTNSIDKTKQYGDFIMSWSVNTQGFLDWKNLSNNQLIEISSKLSECIPEDRLAGFGEQQYLVVKENKDGLKTFKQCQENTRLYYHEYAKASILTDDETPKSIYDELKKDEVVISWREYKGNLNVDSYQLMALMQQYRPELAKELNFKGSRFGDEIVCYDKTLIKKISNHPELVNKKTSKPKIY
jgi:hypothetical protein